MFRKCLIIARFAVTMFTIHSLQTVFAEVALIVGPLSNVFMQFIQLPILIFYVTAAFCAIICIAL